MIKHLVIDIIISVPYFHFFLAKAFASFQKVPLQAQKSEKVNNQWSKKKKKKLTLIFQHSNEEEPAQKFSSFPNIFFL